MIDADDICGIGMMFIIMCNQLVMLFAFYKTCSESHFNSHLDKLDSEKCLFAAIY